MGRYDDYKRHVLRISQRLCADGYFGSKSGSAGNVSMLIEGIDWTPGSTTSGSFSVAPSGDPNSN